MSTRGPDKAGSAPQRRPPGAAQFPKETGAGGDFLRQTSAFREWVTADRSSEYPAQSGRYHLYVSLACPWAHRTLIVRRLKKLEEAVTVSVVDPIRDERGWAFTDSDGCGPDTVNGFSFLSEAYRATDRRYSGRATVPVLWDRARGRIVNNESAEIVRMLNGAFDEWGDRSVDLYPEPLRTAIDATNRIVYHNVNNGVYGAGFAMSQRAYTVAAARLFSTLDELDRRLSAQRYLVGDAATEADWRLFTTLVRFDCVYHGHFKCNRRRLVDYRHLWPYCRDLYQTPGVAETVNFDQIVRHYYMTHDRLNPSRIVPIGPDVDWNEPHRRG